MLSQNDKGLLQDAFKKATVAHMAIDLQKIYCDPTDPDNSYKPALTMKCAFAAHAANSFARNIRPHKIKNIWVAHTPLDLMACREENDTPEMVARRDLYFVHPAEGEPVMAKPRYSAFDGTTLESSLRQCGIQTLLLSGVFLNACVMQTAFGASARGFDVFVLEDLTVATSESMHNVAKESLLTDTRIGFIQSADILSQVCSAAPPGRANRRTYA